MDTRIIGSFEAKTHLSELLKEVNQGKIITITKRGKPIAKLIPYKDTESKISINDILLRFKEIRSKIGDCINIRDYIEDGRKY